jgi:hypothetical protein
VAVSNERLSEEEARYQAMELVRMAPALGVQLLKLQSEGRPWSDILKALQNSACALEQP